MKFQMPKKQVVSKMSKIFKITKKWLVKKNACPEGIKWFSHSNQNDLIIVLKRFISEKRLDWANWLIVHIMIRPQHLAYAIFAAEEVLGIFEKKYPRDNRPRNAINAAKKVLKDDTKKNRKSAVDAAAGAADAAYAAYAAYAVNAYAAADAAAAISYATTNTAKTIAYAVDAAADPIYAARAKLKIKILEYGIRLLEKSTVC